MNRQVAFAWCFRCGTPYVEPEVPEGCYRYIHPDCLCGEDAKTVVVHMTPHEELGHISIDCVEMEMD